MSIIDVDIITVALADRLSLIVFVDYTRPTTGPPSETTTPPPLTPASITIIIIVAGILVISATFAVVRTVVRMFRRRQPAPCIHTLCPCSVPTSTEEVDDCQPINDPLNNHHGNYATVVAEESATGCDRCVTSHQSYNDNVV